MTDAASMSGRIFISYRREDTAYPAGWLYDRLTDRFGGQVFKDVDSIELGDDFVEVITRAVASCDVLLALIGENWLNVKDATGMRRLDDPDDFVRLEIEAALSRKVRVIPILVDDATMPRTEELPESLAGLGRRQALELSPNRFEFDTSRLLRVLESTLAEVREAGDRPDPPPPAPAVRTVAEPRSHPSPNAPPVRPTVSVPRRWLLLGGGAAALLVIVLVAVVAFQQGQRSQLVAVAPATTSRDGLRLTDRTASSQHDPPQVGDTVSVSFTLTNTTDQPIDLPGGAFVAARGPTNDRRDTEPAHVGTTLAPGQSLDTQRDVSITAAGQWQFWPCYETATSLCPDRWTAFSVNVT